MAYDRLKRLPPYDTDGSRPLAIPLQNWQGVNYVDEASALQQTQVPYGKDADFSDPIGAASKRGGKELLFASLGAGGMKGEHTWKHSSGEVMLAAHGTSLYQCAGGSGSKVVPTADYARASVAYKQDGTQVAANTPRYEDSGSVQGLVIEEGTTNLLSANQASVETDLTGIDSYQATITRDTTTFWSGVACVKVVTNNISANEGVRTLPSPTPATAGQTYTLTAYVKGGGTVVLGAGEMIGGTFQLWKDSAVYTLNNTWQRLSVTITLTAGCDGLIIGVRTNVQQSITFYCDGFQIENKAFATSWQLPGSARADEVLTVPTAGIFVKGNWAVELTFTPKDTQNVTYNALWMVYVDDNNYWFITVMDNGYIRGGVGSGGVEYVIDGSIEFQTDASYSILFSGDGANILLCVNGAQIGTRSYIEPLGSLPASMRVGSNQYNYFANGIFKDVRISNRARTLTEHQAAYATGTLTVDEATTDLMSMNGTLNLEGTFSGSKTSCVLDLGNTPKTATIAWTESLPGGSTLIVSVRSSTDGANFGDWRTIAASGNGIPLARYLQVKVDTTGTAPTISDISISFTTDYTSATEIKTGLTGNRVRFADYRPKDYCIVCDGGRPQIVYKDGAGDIQVRDCGVDIPSSAPTLADGGAGSLTGVYLGKVTYINDDGAESNPSAASGSLNITSKQIAWTIPTGPAGIAKRRLYRTKAGGAAYYYVTEIADNTTTTYTDTTADSALGDASHPAMNDTNHVPPDSKIVWEFQNYIFYVPTADESQLWYSKVGEPEQVPNSSTSKNYKAFPGIINGGNSTYNALVIHGDDFVNPIIATATGFIFDSSPTVDTTIVRHIDKAGALSHESIAMCVDPELRQIMVFPTRTGVRFLLPGLQENSLESVPLSRNIQPYYDQAINRGNMAAAFFDNRYILSFCWQESGAATATENNIIFAYDFRSKQWTGPWMIGASCFTIAGNELYCGDAAAGKLFKMFSGSSDGGEAIDFILDLPRIEPAGIEGTCRFNRFLLEVSAESVTTATQVKIKVDEREATVNLGTLTSTYTGDRRPGHDTMRSRKYAIPLPQGHTCSLRIVDNSTNPLCVTKAVIEYEVLPVTT